MYKILLNRYVLVNNMNPLESFPPVYYINLDSRKDRQKHMEGIIQTYSLQATRISAVHGKKPLLGFVENIPDNLRPVEVACCLSHLRAIREWYSTSNTDTAIICEDDVCFDEVKSWGCSWSDIVARLPAYWDVVQLCIIYHPMQDKILNLHHRTTYDFSAAIYMIKRSYAQKLLQLYWKEDIGKWNIDGAYYPLPLTSEEAVYRPGVVLSIPLFTFMGTMGSDIQNQDHLDQYHAFSKQLYHYVWKQYAGKGLALLQMMPQQIIKK
jgi:GR25 family glycosyltransferase involved in LPS biosynthesis